MDYTHKIIEQGNGFAGVTAGAEVYESEGGDLLVIEQVSGTIHTDDSRGNYVFAACRAADQDVTSLSDAEFAALPAVLVRPAR